MQSSYGSKRAKKVIYSPRCMGITLGGERGKAMPENDAPKVFISYSSKDRDDALRIQEALEAENVAVWIDCEAIGVGQSFSDAIEVALNEADYYLLLISENSNNSKWVKREISAAFEQAQKRNLPVIPFLLSQADVPLAFKGLVYIDGTRSFEKGLDQLKKFFKRHTSKVSALVPPETLQKSASPAQMQQHQCKDTLCRLEIGDLRYELSGKLTLKDIRVLWFDVFNTKMEDDVSSQDRATCTLELLDRSGREDRLPKLIDRVCKNHPRISKELG
jgi:TIR domain